MVLLLPMLRRHCASAVLLTVMLGVADGAEPKKQSGLAFGSQTPIPGAHPNLLAIFDTGIENGVSYAVTEWIVNPCASACGEARSPGGRRWRSERLRWTCGCWTGSPRRVAARGGCGIRNDDRRELALARMNCCPPSARAGWAKSGPQIPQETFR